MPKRAVAIFFLAAFLGAAIYVYFTFPRTKAEIPKSNNQRPFPSAPAPGPDNVPVPETVPHPAPPKVPPGPTLRVMAWASADEAKALEAEADAFAAATGRDASLTLVGDPAVYRHDLAQAFASGSPPDVCLISARDFSGLDPTRDLADATPDALDAPRSVAAFTVDGRIKAAPTEFSADVLFYNEAFFNQAGIAFPDRHWNWDILEAISRALFSLHLKNDAGQAVYPLELPANFDFWNVLCAQAGHPALDLDTWHVTDPDARDSQIRALDFIHEFFQELVVTAPPLKADEAPGHLFAQEQAVLLIAPSDLAASLPKFRYNFTLPPSDMARASLAQVNGWAIAAKSSQPEAARILASYLSGQPVHAGWNSVQPPPAGDARGALCYEALAESLVPRVGPRRVDLVRFMDREIQILARNSGQDTAALYAQMQAASRGGVKAAPVEAESAGLKPALLAPSTAQLRGF